MATIGKNILENLTTGMYADSKVIYREYVQNACDQIDKAVELGIIDREQAEVFISIKEDERLILELVFSNMKLNICRIWSLFSKPGAGVSISDFIQYIETNEKEIKDMLCMQDIENIVKNSYNLGLKEIRLTGGEPLIHPQIYEICKEYNQFESVYYAMYCVSTLFDGVIDSAVLAKFKPEDTRYIDQYKGKINTGEVYDWTDSFEKRFFDYRRKIEASKNVKELSKQYDKSLDEL